MDELANDLSYAMIDVDRISNHEFLARLPPSTAKDTRRVFPSTSKEVECSINCNSMSSNDNLKEKSSSGCKGKSSKPVLRSASILLRSKKLILSDSESDDTEKQDGASSTNDDLKNVPRLFGDLNTLSKKHRVKRHRRKKEPKEERTFGLFLSQSQFSQYSGKRKRTSNTQNHSNSICSDDNNLPPSGICHDESKVNGSDHYQMEYDSPSCDSSSLSESNCDSDHFAEADDEQSDFYEFISRSNKGLSKSLMDCNSPSKTKYSPSIPIPGNPFASIPPTPSSSYNSLSGASSAILWKRRRRNH